MKFDKYGFSFDYNPGFQEAVRQGVRQALVGSDLEGERLYAIADALTREMQDVYTELEDLRKLKVEMERDKELKNLLKEQKYKEELEKKALLQRMYELIERERQKVYDQLSAEFEQHLQVLRKENERLRRENLKLKERLRKLPDTD